MRESLVALRRVLKRLGLEHFEVPFRDFKTFGDYVLDKPTV